MKSQIAPGGKGPPGLWLDVWHGSHGGGALSAGRPRGHSGPVTGQSGWQSARGGVHGRICWDRGGFGRGRRSGLGDRLSAPPVCHTRVLTRESPVSGSAGHGAGSWGVKSALRGSGPSLGGAVRKAALAVPLAASSSNSDLSSSQWQSLGRAPCVRGALPGVPRSESAEPPNSLVRRVLLLSLSHRRCNHI